MNGKDLFELLGDLDEDIVEDAWAPDEDIVDDAWTQESRAVMIIEERSPMSFWKAAFLAAAAVCILTVGIFGGLKLHGIQSAESSSDISPSSSDVYDKLNSVVTDGHKFNTEFMSDPSSDILYTDPVIKTDDKNYAVVHISFPNSSKDEHIVLHIRVERKEYLYDGGIYLLGKYKLTPVGEIIVTESKEQTYRIDYKENAAAGDEYVLGLYTTRESGELVHAEGEWLP